MLKKIIKTVLMLSLFTLLVFGEGSHSDNDGGSRNDDIGNIIKNRKKLKNLLNLID